MIIKTLKHIIRTPLPTVAILLFATIIAMIICALQISNDAEMSHFEEVSAKIPIKLTVTERSGTISDLFLVQHWILEVFTGENDPPHALNKYIKDIQVKDHHGISASNGIDLIKMKGSYSLVGITSLDCEKQLLPEYGCEITWYEGYDENIFQGEEAVCIIPENNADIYDNGNGYAFLDFERRETIESKVETWKCQHTFRIVGTYTAGDGNSVYCPYSIIEQLGTELGDTYYTVDYLSATLADNSSLEEFREKMTYWFIEPSPDTDKVPWGRKVNHFTYEYYIYALDIDDENYQKIVNVLENSVKFNRTVTMIVVALSSVAGFLIGFLIIRRRKRDILLMRMVGESNMRIYFGFVFEQMISILLGIAIGGTYNMWKPLDKLALFVLLYFVGLTLSLVVFMNTKLINNIKEDE